MTFRMYGLSDEYRLAIEEASEGTVTTETARLIVEAGVREVEGIIEKALQTATKEVQGVIGPHGAITRLQAGGMNISRGGGMQVYADGVSKTTIDPRGNVIVGSDVTRPATTTEIFFVESDSYNGETFGAGDFLIGDNSASTSNVKWDASEGQLQFRQGTTIQAYMDTDGSIKAGGGDVTIDAIGVTFENQQGVLTFRDTAGNRQTISILSTADDSLYLTNETGGSIIGFRTDTDTHAVLDLLFQEHPSIAEAALLHIDPPSGQALLDIAGGSFIWAGRDGTETVFNDTSHDIDFRIESATNANAVKLDAGNEQVTLFGIAGSALVTADNSAEKRLEIGNDHFIPTRDSSNKIVIFNEAGEDIDFRIEGDTDASLFYVDASADKVGIGDSTPSYKLDVTGDINVTGDFYKGSAVFYRLLGFAPFQLESPVTTSGLFPFVAGVYETITLLKWGQNLYPATTNNGTHYWTVYMTDVAGNTIASFNTSTWTVDTWAQNTITSFSINPIVPATHKQIQVQCIKTGTPGPLYVASPWLAFK
jgi:hypothetical protein